MEVRPSPSGNARVYLEVDTPIGDMSEMYEQYQNGKRFKVDIKPITKKRSLDQNALLWTEIGKIAQALFLDKEDVYHEILRKYGVYTPMQVRKDALPEINELFGYVEQLEDYGEDVLILAYKSIRHMNSAEASRVIDGAITDAKEMGIAD